jgi:predicted nucleotidyltransferase
VDRSRHIRSVLALAEKHGHRAALVGGVAVSLRVRERFTKDIDFAVAVASDAEAEALCLVFQRAGYGLAQVLEQSTKGVIATLRFTVPGGRMEPEIDLLFASSGIEPEVVAAAEPLEITSGLVVPIARLHHLIAMKVLSESDVRENDRADLRALVAIATNRDLELARSAVQLIHERGFARDKNLVDVLSTFVAARR